MPVQSAIHSTLAADPDFADLVQEFVDELPHRVAVIRTSMAEKNLENLCRVIHQLKGACGGYGFSILSDEAAVIEQKLRNKEGFENLQPTLDSYIRLLELATADIE